MTTGRLDANALRAQDVEDVHRAWALDAEAERALFEIADGGDRKKNREATRGPKQLRLRKVARSYPHVLRLYAQADDLYWRIVWRHRRYVRQCANMHARKSHADPEVVWSVALSGAFQAAIRWNPEEATFLTYVGGYIHSAWQRAPERQGVVSLGNSRVTRSDKGFGRLPDAESLDAPVNDVSDTLGVDVLTDPDIVSPEARVEAKVDVSRLLSQLSASDRAYVEARYQDDVESNSDYARRIGVTRQGVDYQLKTILQRIRKTP